jgi:hypothetical protein
MCRSGASCGCGGSSGFPLGRAVAVVALAALVSAAATLIGHVLIAVLAGILVAGSILVGYGLRRAWKLTRPARPPVRRSAAALPASNLRAVPARAPLAIEAPRTAPAAEQVAAAVRRLP